jgi:hypothetical protein
MKFIIVEIGCLECQLPSKFIGYTDSEEEAVKICNKLNSERGSDQDYIYCNLESLPKINIDNIDVILHEHNEEEI